MRKLCSYWLLGIACICCVSCSFFETEKVASETFYEQKMEAIDWSSIDSYPQFEACGEDLEKQQQLQCFTTTLSTRLQQVVDSPYSSTSYPVMDTLVLHLAVSEEARMSLDQIEGKPALFELIPKLDSLLNDAVINMELRAPAYKRAIPVKCQFKLPLIVQSSPL